MGRKHWQTWIHDLILPVGRATLPTHIRPDPEFLPYPSPLLNRELIKCKKQTHCPGQTTLIDSHSSFRHRKFPYPKEVEQSGELERSSRRTRLPALAQWRFQSSRVPDDRVSDLSYRSPTIRAREMAHSGSDGTFPFQPLPAKRTKVFPATMIAPTLTFLFSPGRRTYCSKSIDETEITTLAI